MLIVTILTDNASFYCMLRIKYLLSPFFYPIQHALSHACVTLFTYKFLSNYLVVLGKSTNFATDNIWFFSLVLCMDTDNMLSVLEAYTLESEAEIALKLADDFRHRRIEKNLTREQIAQEASVALSNVVRFEQKGLISLKNLIALAVVLGYTSEIKNLFASPKYATMEELTQIRRNTNKKKAYRKS